MSDSPQWQTALKKWRECVGEEHVLVDVEKLRAQTVATMEIPFTLRAVLSPANRAEVVRCVRIADQQGFSLHPISSGRNWGFGSRSANRDAVVLLDLHRLDQILQVDEELAFAKIGTGVTYRQLNEYLLKHFGRRLWLDPTGASPHSSVLANAIERGHGLGLLCDHFANLGNLSVVLADGDEIETGYDAFPQSKLGPLDAYGLGPATAGLFSQSGLGIVTEGTVWLSPAPESSAVIAIGVNDPQLFVDRVDQARRLRLANVIRTGPHFGNGHFLLSRQMRYPWDRAGHITPLPEPLLQDLLQEKGGSRWTLTMTTSGLKAEVDACVEKIVTVLGEKADRVRVQRLEDLQASENKTWTERTDAERFFWQMNGGIGGTGLPRAYWRSDRDCPANVLDIDLDADRCGVVAVGLVVPFTGRDLQLISSRVTEIMQRSGFDPCLSGAAVRPRTLLIHAFICFAREDLAQAQKAQAVADEILKETMALGYAPYRLGATSMELMDQSSESHRRLFWKLKDALDKNNTIAPGRYEPTRPRAPKNSSGS